MDTRPHETVAPPLPVLPDHDGQQDGKTEPSHRPTRRQSEVSEGRERQGARCLPALNRAAPPGYNKDGFLLQ